MLQQVLFNYPVCLVQVISNNHMANLYNVLIPYFMLTQIVFVFVLIFCHH